MNPSLLRGADRPNPQGRIVVLVPGFGDHGGVQRYSRTLSRAIADYAGERRLAVDVVSLHDPDSWYDRRFVHSPVTGCGGSRLKFVFEASRALAKRHDLVIATHIDLAPLYLPFRLIGPMVPAVVVVHGIEVWQRLPIQKVMALRAAFQVWAVSAFTAGKVSVLQGVLDERIRVLPIPLDPSFGVARSIRPGRRRSDSLTLLTVARLVKADRGGKGIDDVIRALPRIRARVGHVTYVIVGDGDDRARLRELAAANGVGELVRFVGSVPEEVLQAHLARADLFVLPSNKEGFGIAFLEAMAYGLAVIAGAHGGAPEVVLDGETGLLVKHGRPSELEEAILTLYEDPERLRAMGDAGRRRVEETFNYALFSSAIRASLDGLLTPD